MHLGTSLSQESSDLLEHQDLAGLQELVVLLELVEPLDHRVIQDLRARPDRTSLQARAELMDRVVHQVLRVQAGLLVAQVQAVLPDLPERPELLAPVVLQVTTVLQERAVHPDLLALLELLAPLELQVPLAPAARAEVLELQEPLESMVLQERAVLQDLQELPELLVPVILGTLCIGCTATTMWPDR